MPTRIIAPHRFEPFVDEDGRPHRIPQDWIESISRIGNGLNDRIEQNEADIAELEPQFRVVTSADSPVAAANNDYILADMSTGDVTITLPANGRLSVTRSGASNTLTLTGVVNGVTNPTIIGDEDAPSLAYIGTEWRYV
jgi:hypothetical protein